MSLFLYALSLVKKNDEGLLQSKQQNYINTKNMNMILTFFAFFFVFVWSRKKFGSISLAWRNKKGQTVPLQMVGRVCF
ncbi:hypothetical protein BCR42DRAFT_416825 [Absidia repens]|uniref:Uncharacterized protein n=1 Tax=Absidia repens TaxID=90262 RepID=A0A1X2IF12_9FUNG|nr:hypothetical protein BCR42DRAFT_416825 [Absidia repens]